NKVALYSYFIIGSGWFLLLVWILEVERGMLRGLLFWGGLIFIAELFSVSLPYGGYVTLGFPIIYATLLTEGGCVAVLVACIGSLTEFKKGRNVDLEKFFFNCGQFAISTSGAWLVYVNTGGALIKGPVAGKILTILPIGLAALAYFALNSFIVSTVLALERETSVFDMWSNNFKWAAPNYLAQTPLGFLMALIYRQISLWAVTFVMFPLFVAYWAYRLYMDMRKEHLNVIQALAAAIEARDPYTEKHSRRLAEYAVATARELKLSLYSAEIIRYAAILHDIGKIGISDRILAKARSLDEGEWEKIKEHVKIGADILKQIDSLADASKLVYHHHERYNGKGYPLGLKGEEIPIGSRIIAVIDAYDAMTSRRPYRNALSREEAIEELKRHAGTQFDRKVVEAFLRVLKKDTKNVD
ncbi:HD-GYP domain-containing protein, partial [Candidatus Aerophobetes bacterium]|nr:HD-GYP domain-containing protein [Candidatus Aerophobetes bacterium]